jgi:hypothetical protein
VWSALGRVVAFVILLGAGGHVGMHVYSELVSEGTWGVKSSTVVRCWGCERCYRRARRRREYCVLLGGLFGMLGVPAAGAGVVFFFLLGLHDGEWLAAIGVGLSLSVVVPLVLVCWLHPWAAHLVLRPFARRLYRKGQAAWSWGNPLVSLRLSWKRPEKGRVVDLETDAAPHGAEV